MALIDAVRHGRAPDVVALLAGGASWCACDRDGFTPLHAAIVGRHRSVLDVLLDAVGPGAPVLDRQNSYRQTPVHLAARAGDPSLLEPLLAAGASTDFLDERGASALDVCQAHLGRTRLRGRACLAILEKHGAKPGRQAKKRQRRRGDAKKAPGNGRLAV